LDEPEDCAAGGDWVGIDGCCACAATIKAMAEVAVRITRKGARFVIERLRVLNVCRMNADPTIFKGSFVHVVPA
jgi:hypothetical protein